MHPRIHHDVDRDHRAPTARFGSELLHDRTRACQGVHAKCTEKRCLLSLGWGQHQNRQRIPRLPQLDCLLHKRHPQHRRPLLAEDFGTLDKPMTVRICLDDRQD
jgi:hypothetical protein